MVPVTLPETEAVVIEEHESTDPFDAFPGIEMRDDESHGAAMLGREWLAIMFEGENYVRALEIFQRDVRGVAFLGKNQNEFGSGLELDLFEDFRKQNALPTIVEAAPTGNAMEVAGDFGLGEGLADGERTGES